MEARFASRRLAGAAAHRPTAPSHWWYRARAWLAGAEVPPGALVALDVFEKSSRSILLHQSAALGPIFKVTAHRKWWVCMVGLPLGRRFLRDHGDALRPVTLDLESLFPVGFMRQMSGETHRKYRGDLMRALAAADFDAQYPALETIATEELGRFTSPTGGSPGSPEQYLATLGRIGTSMLVRLILGPAPDSRTHEALVDGFAELGPYGLAWHVGDRQRRAFAQIRAILAGWIETLVATGQPEVGVLPALRRGDDVDDVMLGNLIYMVEMGRYDLRAMFRWLSRYAALNGDLCSTIAAEPDAPATRSLCEAFVLETLRLDQSERLLRQVRRDVVFDGFLIPKGATVRICMWESHKDPAHFADPLAFRPDRFLDQSFSPDQFSPFGLDQHHCPFAGVSVRLGRVFLKALCKGYTVRAVDDGPAIRGAYHWEPPSGFSVTLAPRGLQ